MNKNTIFFVSPAENSKPPSGATITTDRCLTHIRDAEHSERYPTTATCHVLAKQCTAAHCNVLKRPATHTAMHCNTLQHACATPCVRVSQWCRIIFPRGGRLWNFGGTHKIHKRFLTKSTGSTWLGKEERDNVKTVHTHLFWWTLIIWK